jgi:predicted nucleic acid-binding Zn ribbon protein
MKRDIARELFRSYWSKTRKSEGVDEERKRRDEPGKLSEVLDELITTRDWKKGIAEGTLFSNWRKIVGDEVANHCEPITLLEGRLTIRAETTAWATQLRLIQDEILKTLQTNSEGVLVEELAVIGPSAPSWKRGLRSIRGAKGPRDTYG